MAEAIKGLNIKLGLDTTELDASIKSLNSELKEQRSDLVAINKNLKYDPSNVDLWRQKQEKLNSILELTKKKLDEQKRQLELAKEGVRLGSVSEQEFNKMKRSVQYTEAEIAKLNSELAETGTKVSALGNINVNALSTIGSAFTKYITAPVTSAVVALKALAIQTTNTVNDMADTAKQLGVGLEAMQKWEYAAKQLGSETESMDKAFQKVNNLLGQIANGEDVSETLSKIGLTMDDLAGLDAEAAFKKIRNAISNVGDAATRTALANQFFGDKLGTSLAPVLSATEEELEEWRKEAEKVGIVSEESAEVTGKVGNEIYALKQAFLSLRTELAVALAPCISKIVNYLKDTVIPRLKELIEKWKEMSSGLKKIIGVIAGVFAAIGPILTIGANVISMVGALGGATKVLGAIAKAGPWAAIIAIIAVLLLQNENFRALLKRILDIVKQLIDKIVELVGKIIEKLKPILDVLMEVINQIIDVLAEIIDGILDAVMLVLDEVVKLLERLIEPITKILEMLTAILIPITQLIAKILQVVAKILQLVIGLVVQIIEVVIELIDGVLNIVIEIINVIVEILGAVINVIVTLLDILVDILTPILEIILAILEPLIEFISGIIEIIAELFEILLPLIQVFLTPIMDILDVIFTIIEAISPILVIIGNVIKAVIVPVLQLLFQILKPILDILNAIISAVKWILDHTVGWLIKLIEKMFGTGDFDAENTVKSTSNQYMNTDNSRTTNNVTINTSGDVDIDSINAALGGAY